MLRSTQGLGFVVFGTVLDKRALKRLGVSMGSVLSTGIPLISALAKPAGYEFGSAEQVSCALTASEINAVQTAFLQRNTTCSFNMTIDSVLGY